MFLSVLCVCVCRFLSMHVCRRGKEMHLDSIGAVLRQLCRECWGVGSLEKLGS